MSKSHSRPEKTQARRQAEMAALLERSGIFLSPCQLDQLWSYHRLLRRYNPQLNLTRIHNFENMVIKLYADAILPGRMTDLPPPLLDLGTGPGMPGIPLKIAFPHLVVILAESRQNRADFLRRAVEELGLSDVSVLGRGITPKFREPVSCVITRAVESIAKTLWRIEGCLAKDGLAVFMKGPDCDAEIGEAGRRFGRELTELQDRAYRIPHTPHERRLVVFRRISTPMREQEESARDRHFFLSIASEQNSTFKKLKKLLSGKGARKQQQALVAGQKQVQELIRDFPERCEAWISGESHPPPPEDAPRSMAWYRLAPDLFRILDVSGTRFPLLLAATPAIHTWQPQQGFSGGCSLLAPFQDPENTGAVIRSAVAFGVRRIILLAESAYPFHPKAIRASGGTVFAADFYQGPSIAGLPADLPLVALSGEGEDIAAAYFPEAFGLLPGVEGGGLPAHLREKAFSIGIAPEVESLNAATAAGIAFYLYSRFRKGG
ncbi:MAG: RsmG family class I SAM-dependent methyltransferase [Desulfosalsimonadaceae bacterium]